MPSPPPTPSLALEPKPSITEVEDALKPSPPRDLTAAAQDADLEEMLAALAETIMPEVPLNRDPAFEKKLVRKIDRRLLMMLMGIYVMNYLDRGNIAFGAVGSLKEDIGVNATQYSTVISIFYVGYLSIQVASNILVAKVRPSIFMPVVMVCWGAVNACTGAVNSFGGMIAARFFLGLVEAPFFPAALYVLSCFYTRTELASRIAILFSAGLMSGAFGGLLATAITSGMDGKGGHAAWRWLFIIEGSMTVPVAAIALWVLPDYPQTTKWLSPEEKKLAVYRLAAQNVSPHTIAQEEEMTIPQALKAAFTDPNTYLLWFCQLMLNSAATFTNFFPSIVATLGYNRVGTYLLSAPPYVFVAIVSVANSLHGDKVGERYWHIVFGQVLALCGFVIAASTLNVAARYVSCFLMMSVYASFGSVLSWIQTSTPAPPLKKAVVYAIVNAGSNFAAVYGSYLYPSTDAPRYLPANAANIAFCAACIFFATGLRLRLRYLNKQLDRAEEVDLQNEGKPIGAESEKLLKKLRIEPTYRYML
ncbi:hypothetical protein IAT38_003035 [Cryptococcus sp. DSM 104549]